MNNWERGRPRYIQAVDVGFCIVFSSVIIIASLANVT